MNKREKNGVVVRVVVVAFSAFAAAAAMLAAAGTGYAHYLGYDSVDGREIRYEEHTRFDDEREFGVKQWNDLGSISIRQESSGTDLDFRDYRDCNDGALAFWQFRSGVDRIAFNTCLMVRLDNFDQRGTATHELGHALGLAHTPDRIKWCARSIMYPSTCENSPNKPRAHDREDYYGLWGRSGASAERESSVTEPSNASPSNIEPRYAFEATDPRKLVGFATDVFVGRVVGKTGSEGAPLSGPGRKSVPRTQFSVEVSRTLKGDAEGTVTVNQIGGYDGEEGREVRVKGDRPLRPGREYLFATGLDPEKGWYTVVAQPFGNVPVYDEGRRTEIEERFARAEEEQISFDPNAP